MYLKVWDEAVPPGTTDADFIDESINDTKTAIRERIEQILPGWADDDEDPKRFPGWIVTLFGLQNVPAGAIIKVNWDTEERDSPDLYFEAPSNTITIPPNLGGFYIMGTTVEWGTSNTDIPEIVIRRNGVGLSVERRGILLVFTLPGVKGTSKTFILERLDVGDELQVEVSKTSILIPIGGGGLGDTITNFWGLRLGG